MGRTLVSRRGVRFISSTSATRFGFACVFACVLAMLPVLAWAAHPLKHAIWYARDLQKVCTANKATNPGEYGMCWSFVSAVFEIATDQKIYGYAVCVIPPLVTAQKAVEVTAAWLGAHPDAAMEPASLATVQALAAAYPCKTKK